MSRRPAPGSRPQPVDAPRAAVVKLIAAGLSDKQILKIVNSEFPRRRVTIAVVREIRQRLRVAQRVVL